MVLMYHGTQSIFFGFWRKDPPNCKSLLKTYVEHTGMRPDLFMRKCEKSWRE